MGNQTETYLKKMCNHLNWYSMKLNTHTATGFGNKQVSDFIIANNNGVYAVECKQRKDYFNSNDLTQSFEMQKLLNKTDKIIPYILLNFYGKGKKYLIPYKEFKEILKNNVFYNGARKVGLKYNDIPSRYNLIHWKNIKDKL